MSYVNSAILTATLKSGEPEQALQITWVAFIIIILASFAFI